MRKFGGKDNRRRMRQRSGKAERLGEGKDERVGRNGWMRD